MNGTSTMNSWYFECQISGIHYPTAHWGHTQHPPIFCITNIGDSHCYGTVRLHNTFPDISYLKYRGIGQIFHKTGSYKSPDIWHSKYRGIWLMAKFPDFYYTENRVFGHFNNSYIDSLALHCPHYTKDVYRFFKGWVDYRGWFRLSLCTQQAIELYPAQMA